MELGIALISIVAGLVALIGGGELLIRSASELAAAASISPVVIGLTVVALATSAPELAVVVQSSFVGKTDLAIGNTVGSNICNVLLVLGLSALVSPLVVISRLVRIDVPVMIGASILMMILSLDGHLGRFDGILLFGSLVCYVVWSIRENRKAVQVVKAESVEAYGGTAKSLSLQIILLIAGLALLVLGAHYAVAGAVNIAMLLGVSELIIGLTVVALGTSLPEVVTSVVASYRGERDIAVGNVVGSNLYNILGVLGLGSIIAPNGIDVSINALRFDIPVMITVAIACLPIFFVGNRIERWEGGLLFGYYLAYTSYLVLHASGHGLGRVLGVVLILFVIPLTVLTLFIGVYRYWHKLQQAEATRS